jgi:hypothetical protein
MLSRISLILLLLVCATSLFAQTPVDQDDVIRTETDVTNLPFTVIDQQHRFITTLRAEDLRVFEDGVPQQLFTFQRETERPLSIAFLIDVSISQQRTLADEKAAARGFIEKAVRSNKDQLAIHSIHRSCISRARIDARRSECLPRSATG